MGRAEETRPRREVTVNRSVCFVVAMLGVVLSSVTFAGDAFVGVSGGQAKYKQRTATGIDISSDDTGWKIFGGKYFATYFGAEGGYVDFGSFEETDQDRSLDAEVNGWDAFGVVVFPFTPRFSLWAKAGLVRWDLQSVLIEGDEPTTLDDSGTDFAWGGGLTFQIKRVAIRIEYEVFNVGDLEDLTLSSAGLEFRF
jgi:hypothetical protein